jgi:hypothetical protein
MAPLAAAVPSVNLNQHPLRPGEVKVGEGVLGERFRLNAK